MVPMTQERPTARQRLLAAADELFYEEGLHAVGIDRVIERAGVAKATLYNTFGSKEELIKAYLEGRDTQRRERITGKLSRYTEPRQRLLGLFDVLGETIAMPSFRGCAFLRASTESAEGDAVTQVCDAYRGWLHLLLVDLATEAGARDPADLAAKLAVLYDGVMTGAQMDKELGSAATARSIAQILVDTAVA